MVKDVDAIVLASVTSTQPGRVVTSGVRTLPFTLVNLQVELAIQGDVGSSITVEQTGGAGEKGVIFIDGDGGAYMSGQQVLLFLKEQPDTGLYYLVNPQGRFRVEHGTLSAVAEDDAVAQTLHARGVGQAIAMIRSAR